MTGSTGVFAQTYLVDFTNSAYGIDPAGTSNFGGYSLKITGGALLAVDTGNVGIGDATPDAKLNILATTEQLRLDYDDSNYASFTVSSAGDLTLAPSGGDVNVTGDTDISSQLALGDNASITANEIASITDTSVDINVASTAGYYMAQTLTGSTGSGYYYGMKNTLTESSSSISNKTHIAYYAALTNNNASAGSDGIWISQEGIFTNQVAATLGTVQTFYAELANAGGTLGGTLASNYYSKINNPTGTITNAYNFYAATPTNTVGTITTGYGLYVADQSVGTNTTAYGVYIDNQAGSSGNAIGLYIADADDYSIQLASTDGNAASGITFGTDTNLYRSGANILHTDDSFDADGSLTVGSSGQFSVDANGNISTSGTTGLTFSSTGGVNLAGGTLSDTTDGVDINDDLEIAGGTTIGDNIADTVTVNSGAWTFANDTTIALTGGLNGLNIDSNTLSIDAASNYVGIGTAAPAAILDVIKGGVSGATPYSASIASFQSNAAAYVSILTPTNSENGVFFGQAWSNVAGGIIYDTAAVDQGFEFRNNGNVFKMALTSGGNLGVNTSGPDARIDYLATSGEQLRLTYTDGSVYSGFTVNSGGGLTKIGRAH